MIYDFHNATSRSEVGVYCGILVAMFFLGRCLGTPFWGWFIERKGRKTAMVLALISITIFSVFFGIAHNFVWACFVRFLLGLMSAIPTISKIMINEI